MFVKKSMQLINSNLRRLRRKMHYSKVLFPILCIFLFWYILIQYKPVSLSMMNVIPNSIYPRWFIKQSIPPTKHHTKPRFIKNIKQSYNTIEYISSYLKVTYIPLTNWDKINIHEVMLENVGPEQITDLDWEIYFNHFENLILINGASYPCNFSLEVISRGFSRIKPDENFAGINPSEFCLLQIEGAIAIDRYYVFPRWYVIGPGAKPKVIRSTDDENLKFVSEYKSPEQWKRSYYDYYDPLSLSNRFSLYHRKDLQNAPLHVIPSPFVENLSTNLFVEIDFTWGICNAVPQFVNEIYLFAGIFNIRKIQSKNCPTSKVIKFSKTTQSKTLNKESYEIDVDSKRNFIQIQAGSNAGVFYAIQTLQSIAETNHKKLSNRIPVGNIKDFPRFHYRGVQLDVARNFMKLDDLLLLIKIMGMYKLNKLHLHLTDNEGWRIEIDGLPELTKIGSVRCHSEREETNLFPFFGSGPGNKTSGTGYYSKSDYQTILKAASQNHIEVIPEIDVPGHSHAAVCAMKARYLFYKNKGDLANAKRFLLDDMEMNHKYSICPTVVMNPCLESTYWFVDHVITALKAMHKPIQPLKLIHLGGDEVPASSWIDSKACVNLFSSLDSSNNISYMFFEPAFEIQSHFTKKVYKLSKNIHNLKMGVWEDAVKDPTACELTGKDCSMIAYVWRSSFADGTLDGAYYLANNGYQVVLALATHLYFDHPQEPDPEEPGLTWATRFIDDMTVFNFQPDNIFENARSLNEGDPISDEQIETVREYSMKLNVTKNVIGMEANLWSELIRTRRLAHYQLFPRLIAFAERAWHKADWENDNSKKMAALRDHDWNRFANVVGYKELARLQKLGIEYRIPPPGVNIVNGTFQFAALYPGLKYLFRPIGSSANWSEARTGDLVPNKDVRYEFATSDNSRLSRVVRMT